MWKIMILGHITNINQEGVLYPAALHKGLMYLNNTDFSKVENGKNNIDGDNMIAIVSEYLPDIKENRQAETHQKYIDIQYLVSGEEFIGVACSADGVPEPEGYLAEKDATFYASVNNEIEIKLLAGMYVVFFPWDIHRPGCISQAGGKVRKVVLKVRATQLFPKAI